MRGRLHLKLQSQLAATSTVTILHTFSSLSPRRLPEIWDVMHYSSRISHSQAYFRRHETPTRSHDMFTPLHLMRRFPMILRISAIRDHRGVYKDVRGEASYRYRLLALKLMHAMYPGRVRVDVVLQVIRFPAFDYAFVQETGYRISREVHLVHSL